MDDGFALIVQVGMRLASIGVTVVDVVVAEVVDADVVVAVTAVVVALVDVATSASTTPVPPATASIPANTITIRSRHTESRPLFFCFIMIFLTSSNDSSIASNSTMPAT
jgi:hypothetical protein